MKIADAKTVSPSLKATSFNKHLLGFVKWLLDAPEGTRRFAVRSGRSMRYYQTDRRGEDGLLEIKTWNSSMQRPEIGELADAVFERIDLDPIDLVLRGVIAAALPKSALRTSDAPCLEDMVADIRDLGRIDPEGIYLALAGPWVAEWWISEGERRYRQILRKTRVCERMALFGRVTTFNPKISDDVMRLLPSRFTPTLPAYRSIRPMFAATVIGESAKRFQIREIRPINGQANASIVSGVGPFFVDREYLIADRITEQDFEAAIAFDRDHVLSLEAAASEAVAAMIPAFQGYADDAERVKSEHQARFGRLIAACQGAA